MFLIVEIFLFCIGEGNFYRLVFVCLEIWSLCCKVKVEGVELFGIFW